MENTTKIQKILNKLISEEIIAGHLYNSCIVAAKKNVSNEYSKLFKDIAVDELDDHAKNLIEWARENEYDVPYKFKNIEKYSDEQLVKLLNSLKNDEKAKYYVEKAIKSEELAIKSYEQIQTDDIPYSLEQILLQNMYDEIEHFDKLNTLMLAIDADVSLIYNN